MTNRNLLFLIALVGVILSACDKEYVQPLTIDSIGALGTCANIEGYVDTHFPNANIKKIEHQKQGQQKVYDISLTDDIQLKFNQACEVISIRTIQGIPNSALMPGIVEYMASFYPNAAVMTWELFSEYQEITLNNSQKIRFDLAGQLFSGSFDTCFFIQDFVETHFPDLTIVKVEIEDDEKPYYDVYLTEGVELEFTLQCEIFEIIAPNGIPSSALMPGIVSYVASNFPNLIIVEWELYDDYQEITLSNGQEIEFDLSGQILSGGPNVCPGITDFVTTHFPGFSITKIELEQGNRPYYDVYLTGGVELEFTLQCEIFEIIAPNGIPSSALMPGIVSYVASNFPNALILEWELYPNYQEIYLSNDLYIEFDLNGNFIGIDD